MARLLRTAAPCFFLTLLIFGYRWHLFGGIGGYVDPRSGQPQALAPGLMATMKVLLFRLWGPLYFPVNWSSLPGPALVPVITAGTLAYLALSRARAEQSRLVFAVSFTIVTALPALHQLLISESLEKSRLLYLPSVGFCLLLGAAIDGTKASRQRWLISAGLLLLHSGALRHNLSIWGNVARLADQTCTDVCDALT